MSTRATEPHILARNPYRPIWTLQLWKFAVTRQPIHRHVLETLEQHGGRTTLHHCIDAAPHLAQSPAPRGLLL